MKVEKLRNVSIIAWTTLVVLDIFLNVILIDEITPELAVRVVGIVALSFIIITLPLLQFLWVRRTESSRFRELFTLLSDGIIVMNPNRKITFINPAAITMTGFQLNDSVPFCLYCQNRPISPGQQRCLLAEERRRHYFESELPTKYGWVNVGMSRTFLSPRATTSERDMVITIRDVTVQKQEEELHLSRRLTHHAYKIQEEERKRLSLELHDGVSQTLYGIGLGLEHLARHMEHPSLKQELLSLHSQVQGATEEVRSLSHSLYPAALYRIGLIAALRLMADTLTTPQRKVLFITSFQEEPPFDADATVHLYRITQEAVHNAVMHGRANLIEISLREHGDHVQLAIEDNGRGFSAETETGGYGLRNMEERARAIGATLEVSSQLHVGTLVKLKIAKKSAFPAALPKPEESIW